MKQKYVLIGGFTLMFSVSLGLILFERGQDQAIGSGSARNVSQDILGASLALDNSLVFYRQSAAKIASILDALTDNIAAGQAINKSDIDQIIVNLLAASVPAAYRDLHFKLTTLASHIKNSAQPDVAYLREQIRLLKAEFPWL